MVEKSLTEMQKNIKELLEWKRDLFHTFEALTKHIDDSLWYDRIGDIAKIDKIRFTGPPPSDRALKVLKDLESRINPAYALSRQPEDKVIIHAYTFTPNNLEKNRKYPLIVLIHGGIHGNISSSSANIVRELIEQEYIIIAPDYRGSCGYGAIYWNLVDYGSTMIEDIYTSRNWMIEHCRQVDPDRIGIMGWSMGGYNTIMQILNYPDAYSVAFAGVPVSDLLIRLSYRPWEAESRAEVYSGGHITDQYELRKRSPAWNAAKLETPLLIHAASNDRDVYITEIENLIAHLKAAGKQFEHKIYEVPPGGHAFESLDTNYARNARKEAYGFLAKYLHPGNHQK